MPKRVFIAFAKEDERMRNLLKCQSLNAGSPFEYVDMSVKQPYSAAWKQRTRARVRAWFGWRHRADQQEHATGRRATLGDSVRDHREEAPVGVVDPRRRSDEAEGDGRNENR